MYGRDNGNPGEHTPMWELEERLFGEGYVRVRSAYFISLKMDEQWDRSG